jgi:hypothetical protein
MVISLGWPILGPNILFPKRIPSAASGKLTAKGKGVSGTRRAGLFRKAAPGGNLPSEKLT